MSFTDQIKLTIERVTAEKETIDKEIQRLEEEFANVKLNPYGITAIDFNKRQELSADTLKMEGVIMGLTLALEVYDEIISA